MNDFGKDIDFGKIWEDYQQCDIAQKVESVSDSFDEAYDELVSGSGLQGDAMPWLKTHENFRFSSGELTIWAGVNGNGKSLVMSQCAIWFSGTTILASMEMPPHKTRGRMIRQSTGMSTPTKEFARASVDALGDKIWIFNHIGKVSEDEIRGMIVYAATELEAKHVMIDSLVKCGLGVDDYNKQRDFVSDLSELAKQYKVHIHLVVHMRKGMSETVIPDKFSVKGAGEITDLADNLLIVARNTKKDAVMRSSDEDAKESYQEHPDAYIRVAKNRHGEWEGTFSFWWHGPSMQWVAKYNGSPQIYLENWSNRT